MKKFLNKIKGYIGVLLLIVALLTIYYWENYGRERFLYTEAYVFKENIDKNTIITEELIKNAATVLKVDQSQMVDDPVTDITSIIGLETKHYIPKNAQLSNKYFDEPKIVLDEDEYIFAVPKEWILDFPSSLRRKDNVYFYKIKNYKLGTDTNFEELIENNIAEFVLSATVAYVKDSTNKEVVSIGEDRLDGTAKIDVIEIIVTKEKVKKLKDAYEAGYQFILMYQE